jgi:flagellin
MLSTNAHRNVKNTGAGMARASNRLSSGYRVNTAADDAAGLAISETMRAQIRGLDQASRNAQDGASMVQTAEGGLQGINDKLGRIRELVVQAANDTYTFEQREMIQMEINQLMDEINATVRRVEFNGMRLLDGSASTIRIPAMEKPAQNMIEISYALITGASGSRTQIGNLYDEFRAIPDPPIGSLADFQSVAARLGAIVDDAHNAFVQIITTTNYIVSAIGNAQFDPALLTSYFTSLSHHWHGGHGHFGYNDAYLMPAVQGTENALATSDPVEAQRQLLIAFRGFGADTVLPPNITVGGAWGGGSAGVGMVHCHDSIANAAWALLEGMVMLIPPVRGHDTIWFQTGANSSQGMNVNIEGMSTLHLGAPIGDLEDLIDVRHDNGLPITTQLNIIDRAIPRVLEERAKLGAVQNRLAYTMRSLDIASENLQDSESRIRNADMAKEKMEFLQTAVLRQSGILMLAQANSLPNNLLELLA